MYYQSSTVIISLQNLVLQNPMAAYSSTLTQRLDTHCVDQVFELLYSVIHVTVDVHLNNIDAMDTVKYCEVQ